MPQRRPTRTPPAWAAWRVACAVGAAFMLPTAAMAQGMPQLDFTTPLTVSQVVWGVLIFALLYVLLTQWGLPEVDEVLQRRATVVAADLDTARAAKLQADAAVAEMTEAIGHARAQAQIAINSAVDRAKQEAAAQSATLNERLEAQLQAAERQIGEARVAAMGALRQVASETATTVIHRLTGANPDRQKVDGAVAAVLAARQA
jgi:F-type H+-transporting ATPase subunit b